MTLLFPLGPPADPEERDRRLMEVALASARRAAAEEEVPVGAIVVLDNRLIGRSGNQVEALHDATAHAEMLALSQAFAAVGAKRLEGAELFCTLEPCLMCAGALLHARLARVVYGASDPKFGAVESLCHAFDLSGLNHRIEARGGVEAAASATLLQSFFRARRGKSGPAVDGPAADSGTAGHSG